MLIEIPGNSWIDPTTVIRIAMWPAYIEPAGVPPPAIKNDAFSGMVIITSRGGLTTVVRFHTEEDAVNWTKTFAAHCNAILRTQHDNTEWRLTLQKITDNG